VHKRSQYVSNLQVSFVFMHILLGDMLMCLINVINNIHCLWYIYTARQMKMHPKNVRVIQVQKGQIKNLVTPKQAQ
jgi:hypothetical protein